MKECCKEYLMEQFGDMDVSQEIYNEYVSSMHAKLVEAEAALAEAAWTQLDRIVHALKGNALAAGDNAVADVAIAIRSAAKLSDSNECTRLIGELKELEKQL